MPLASRWTLFRCEPGYGECLHKGQRYRQGLEIAFGLGTLMVNGESAVSTTSGVVAALVYSLGTSGLISETLPRSMLTFYRPANRPSQNFYLVTRSNWLFSFTRATPGR